MLDLETLSEEDKNNLKVALKTWKDAGVDRPLIPSYSDFDGDDVPDFIGLDEAGELVLVSGVTVSETVQEDSGELTGE